MQTIKRKVQWLGLLAGIVAIAAAGASLAANEDKPAALSEEAQAILSLPADSEYGEYLAGECSSCHNPNATDDAKVPRIHGVARESIIVNLLAYKSGEKDNTTMKGVAEKFSHEEIAALAIYLAEYKPN